MNDFDLWHKRLEAARKEREPHAEIWKKLLRHTAGRNFRKGFFPDGNVQPVNLLNNFCRIVLPHLLPRNRPLVCEVAPKRPGPEYAASAELLGDRLNAVAREIRMLDQVRKAVRASFYSAGVLKVGFEVRTGIVQEVEAENGEKSKSRKVETPGAGYAGESDRLIAGPTNAGPQASGLKPQASESSVNSVAVDVDRERVEGREYLDADLPFVCSVKAPRFSVEVGPTAIDEARWTAHETYRSIASLKADPRFAHCAGYLKATHRALPRSFQEVTAPLSAEGEADPLLSYVQVFEVYDRDRRRVLWIGGKGCGYEQPLAEGEWPAGIEGFPFVLLQYEEVEDYFWPNPPLAVTFDMGSGVDTFLTAMIEAAKSAKTVVLFDPQYLKPDQAAAIANCSHGDLVPCPGLGEHVQVVTFPGPTKDHWDVFERLKILSDEMNGVGDAQRGVTASSSVPTATAVSAAMSYSGVRMEDMQAGVSEACVKCLEMVGALLVVHQDMMADVTLHAGDPREGRFVALGPGVVGEYLDYAYELAVGSTERVDPAIKQKRTQDLIAQSMDPNMAAKLQAEGKAMLTAPLVERQLRSLGESNYQQYLVDLPPPQQEGEQQAAAAEDAEMVSGGRALPVSPNQDHAAHVEVHQADYQQSGSQAIAEHIMMHEQYMQPAEQQGGGNPQSGMGGPPGMGTGGGGDMMGAMQRQVA